MNLGWKNTPNPKIFGIGLTKTGTRSLAEALTILGYKTIHYPWSLDDIQRHQASTDIPVSCRYKNLDQIYPGSKFILTTRPYEDWIRTVSMKPADPHKPPLWKLDVRLTMYGVLHFDQDAWTKTFHRHHDDVEQYFRNRSDLLILDLNVEDKWEKLCGFLGKKVPNVPYPHLGKNPLLQRSVVSQFTPKAEL